MHHNYHVFPDVVFLVLSVTSATYLAMRAGGLRVFGTPWGSRARVALLCLFVALLGLGYLLVFIRVSRRFNADAATWIQAAALIAGIWAIFAAAFLVLLRRIPYRQERRDIVHAAGALALASPALAIAFGIIHRTDFRLSEVSIPFAGLPHDLDGLRIVQISDIHLSPFLSERELARAIDMANEARADVALVTGDLITRKGDPLDACLRQISRLKAQAGVFGCMGNHEAYADAEAYVEREAALRGIRFLRHEAAGLHFGESVLNIAGVDYQRLKGPYLRRAGELVDPGRFNLLLSHNPDVFPVAARQGWDLTISGHTHGGQIDVEILHQDLSVARYYTPFVRGLYRRDRAAVYVSTGLGTVGVPIRLGATPEVSLVRLCAI